MQRILMSVILCVLEIKRCRLLRIQLQISETSDIYTQEYNIDSKEVKKPKQWKRRLEADGDSNNNGDPKRQCTLPAMLSSYKACL